MTTFLIVTTAILGLSLLWQRIQLTRFERRLRQEHAALLAVTSGVVTVRPDGTIRSIDGAAQRAFGFAEREVVGRPVTSLVALDERGFEPGPPAKANQVRSWEALIHEGRPIVARTKDGTAFPISLRPCSLKAKEGNDVVLVVQDITRQRMLEDELRRHVAQLIATKGAVESQNEVLELTVRERTAELERARATAERANRAKSEFLGNVSHELKTPLHGILSFARFGIRKFDQSPPEKLREYFERIFESGTTLLTTLEELLMLSRLEYGIVVLERTDFDPAKLVETVVAEVAALAREKGVTLSVTNRGSPAVVHADRDKIAKVVRNLLNNAVRHSPRDGTVEIGLAEDKGALVVGVYDDGPGIPEAEQEEVFGKFVQASNRQPGSGGTGLGLAICREIAKLHGGQIHTHNRSTGGAAFEFSIPVSGTDEATHAALPSKYLVTSSTQ